MACSFDRVLSARVAMAALAGGLVLAAGTFPARADDITVFHSPPSVSELRTALGSGAPHMKTRSIVIDLNEAAPAGPAAGPSIQPASAGETPQAQAPAPQAPRQTETVSEKAVAVQIHFDLNSARLRPEAGPYLESIAKFLQADPQTRLIIEGHTDATGEFAHNMTLSRGRAGTVRDALESQYGIAPDRLVALGKGPKEPLPETDPASGENRRVQIRLRN